MNRPIAFVCALLFASLSVSSACFAQPGNWVHFTLEKDRKNSGKIHASFRNDEEDRHQNNWSTAFMPSDLIGFEVSSFHAAGSRPLHFAVVREAGRLDCAGHGGENYAAGNCSFSENPAFTQLLASHGIGRPTREQAFGLVAVNARREIIDAIAAANYPTPKIDDLMALAALEIDGRYIAGIAQAGYRPQSIQRLIEFKALGVTPQWIKGFVRVGYANLPGDGLVQMRALGITPDYILGFQRIGYRSLPVDTLVQLKALDITPEFVASIARGGPLPPASRLAEMKMFGRRR